LFARTYPLGASFPTLVTCSPDHVACPSARPDAICARLNRKYLKYQGVLAAPTLRGARELAPGTVVVAADGEGAGGSLDGLRAAVMGEFVSELLDVYSENAAGKDSPSTVCG